MSTPVEVLHIFISPGHNYFGHHGKPAGTNPIRAVPKIQCIAGSGIEGDRFFDYKENFKGQITFFASEVYEELCIMFDAWDVPPSVFRRNVITRGLDLNALINKEFEVQGVKLFGAESCKPCHWMNEAFGPGAEDALQGRGGLRARILTSGSLQVTTSTVARVSSKIGQKS
jgi:MOSC domain-containing protein YiiM